MIYKLKQHKQTYTRKQPTATQGLSLFHAPVRTTHTSVQLSPPPLPPQPSTTLALIDSPQLPTAPTAAVKPIVRGGPQCLTVGNTMSPCPVVPIDSPKTPVSTTRMLATPHSDDTWDRMPYRPLPPYCEVVQINNRTFLSMVSDSQTATYQVAVALTEDECKIYQTPPKDMILMKITDTGKVVKAYKPFQDTIAKLRVGKQLPSVRTDQSVTKAITQVMVCDPCPTPCCSQPL